MSAGDFRCANEKCEFHHKPLHFLQPTVDGCELYLACPGCRRVSNYPGLPVDDRSTPKVWIRIGFGCSTCGPKHLTEFNALVPDTEGRHMRNDVQTKLRMGYWTGTLPCGHPVMPTDDGGFCFERLDRRIA